MDTKKDGHIPGLAGAINYPLYQALIQRRSRRFRLGNTMTIGPLKYETKKDVVPLNKEEKALLCFAGAGSTGLALMEAVPGYGGNTLMHWTSRSFPSPCNNHRTRLIYSDDDGVYLYNPKEAVNIVEAETLDELEKRIRSFDEELIKLKDGRIDVAPKPPAFSSLNSGSVNRRGQVWFMPIVDPAYEIINMVMTSIQYDHWLLYDDETNKPAGIDKWIDKLKLTVKVPVSYLSSSVANMCTVEAGFINQNILLMAQAMGLGAFSFGAYVSLIIMGGTPATRGLGFRFTTDKKGLPNPVGIDGLIEAYCPPYMTMDQAVDAVVATKFGANGIFTNPQEAIPYKDRSLMPQNPIDDKIPDEVIQCVKDFCNYVYDEYGRFPSNADTLSMPLGITVHHIDTDFYKTHYKPGAVTENIERHLAEWHSL